MANLDPTVLVTITLLRWLRGSRVGTVSLDVASGASILTYGRPYRVTILVMLAIASGAVALGVVVFWGDPARQVIVGGIFGLLWGAVAIGAWDCFAVQLRVSELGLERSAPRSRSRVIPWGSMASVEYLSTANWYAFRPMQGRAIYVSIYRNGLDTLINMSERGLEQSRVGSLPASFYHHAAA